MEGLDSDCGIDRRATMRVYNSRTTNALDIGMLRGLLSGSIRLQQRRHTAGLADTDVCPFCGIHAETLEHCFWQCPRWEHIRAAAELPSQEIRDAWPACTRQCGIFMKQQGHTVAAARLQRHTAAQLHHMFIHIVEARRECEAALRGELLDEAVAPEHEHAELDCD